MFLIRSTKYISLFIAYLFLIGCAANVHERLGVSELEWTSYSQDKQKVLLTNYERVTKERASELGQQQKKDKNALDVQALEVSIYGGKAMFPPAFINWYAYHPVHFNILSGECHNIELIQTADVESKTELRVCFHNNVLYLDASNYDLTKKFGSVSIYHSPLWSSGFAYKEISSSGYVKLNNVTVEIKQLDSVPALDK